MNEGNMQGIVEVLEMQFPIRPNIPGEPPGAHQGLGAVASAMLGEISEPFHERGRRVIEANEQETVPALQANRQ